MLNREAVSRSFTRFSVLIGSALVLLAIAIGATAASDTFEPGSWRIVAVMGEELPEQNRTPSFDLAMDGNSFSATIGCNTFGGQIALSKDGVSFGPARSTRMGCPPSLDRLEDGFGTALDTSVTWSRDGDMITITGSNGEATLVLIRANDG